MDRLKDLTSEHRELLRELAKDRLDVNKYMLEHPEELEHEEESIALVTEETKLLEEIMEIV